MRTRLVSPVLTSQLALELGLPFEGEDTQIKSVAPLSDARPNALAFASKLPANALPRSACVIAGEPIGESTCIISERQRLDFVKALHILDRIGQFEAADEAPMIHPSARIGHHVSIGGKVVIGAGTRIEPFVRIADDTTVGQDCWIKSGAVIGEAGFGHERDLDGTPLRMIHLGGVVIGNRVEIGSLTTVCQGALRPTEIEDDAKIDDHVHVAHNCRIEKKAILTACAELSGGVVVEQEAWLGPNVAVMENVTIGARSLVGIGATVLRDVAAGSTVVGNPAKALNR